MYTRVFLKIYNWQNRKLVYEIHSIVELKKNPISRTENFLNLGDQQFYTISEILQSAYIVPRDIEDNIFYLNNYID